MREAARLSHPAVRSRQATECPAAIRSRAATGFWQAMRLRIQPRTGLHRRTDMFRRLGQALSLRRRLRAASPRHSPGKPARRERQEIQKQTTDIYRYSDME